MSEAWGVGPALIRGVGAALVALGVPAAAWVGWQSRAAWMRAFAVLVAAACVYANHHLLRLDYEAGHFFVAWAAAVLAAAALARAPRPRWVGSLSSSARIVALGCLVCFAVFGAVVPPRQPVRIEMLKTQGAVFTPILSLRGHAQGGGADRAVVPEAWRPWLASREALPAIASHEDPAVTGHRIVLLLTIDSLRAEVLSSGRHEDELPVLSGLWHDATVFTNAHSPATQTVTTFASLFSGKYFSELDWELGDGGLTWPAQDPSPRFPALLSEAGVATVQIGSVLWLSEANGLTVGFRETDVTRTSKQNLPADVLVKKLEERLAKQGDGPLFAFVHFMDAHFPYSPGPQPALFRYMQKLRYVDAQIGRLRAAIRRLGIAPRTTLVLTADHGEAFGEHGSYHHGYNVYDEVVRVPLIFDGPHPAGNIDVPVTLLDLGPTFLDLFGVATPASFMGESLVPFLRGENAKLTRPILSEARLKQALYFDDGVKIIRDLRNGTRELYDLGRDPREHDNRADDPRFDPEGRFGALGAYYGTHAFARPGYKTPIRR